MENNMVLHSVAKRPASSPSQSESQKNKKGLDQSSASSAFGARFFYFIMYGLYYLSLMLYSNPLRDIITLKNGFILSDFIYLIYYTSFHGLAIYYFLTAGARPGFVNETEAEIDQ